MNKLFRCAPTRLKLPVGDKLLEGLKVEIMQGGLVEGKPTLHFVVEGHAEFLIHCSELRQTLDILEPVKPKRERKKKVKALGQTLLEKVVTP